MNDTIASSLQGYGYNVGKCIDSSDSLFDATAPSHYYRYVIDWYPTPTPSATPKHNTNAICDAHL